MCNEKFTKKAFENACKRTMKYVYLIYTNMVNTMQNSELQKDLNTIRQLAVQVLCDDRTPVELHEQLADIQERAEAALSKLNEEN